MLPLITFLYILATTTAMAVDPSGTLFMSMVCSITIATMSMMVLVTLPKALQKFVFAPPNPMGTYFKDMVSTKAGVKALPIIDIVTAMIPKTISSMYAYVNKVLHTSTTIVVDTTTITASTSTDLASDHGQQDFETELVSATASFLDNKVDAMKCLRKSTYPRSKRGLPISECISGGSTPGLNCAVM
ncbi:hypothetical protein P280DRAFT_216087 [Massarina eburnea CBS 473.64]|uniref:Uncharacterized protein n=1 Tax=Massarina eburnea CBS 473.64 TaxID=1395130 RepID=A0A6A6SC65_9PLEO|nr:hypothetical protein P280DRAFT_216087 [Massarina eburnea CBS 473.64]